MAERAAAVPSLPRDAVSEILSWAPRRSLCRFRSVSKEWQALICDPAFVAQHKSRALPDLLLVTSYSGENPYRDSSVLVMDTEGTLVREIKGLGTYPTFASSLDNLICVRCSGDVTRVVDMATGTVLVTSEIPSSKKPNGNLRNYVIRLGRAAVSGSYKAVRVVDFRRAYGVQPPQSCEALTIGRYGGTNWRRVQPPPTSVRMLDFSGDWAGATVDGVVYFLCSGGGNAWDSVLGFDLDSEEWRKMIDGPTELSSWSTHKHTRIGELNKSLCMIQTGARKNDQPPAGIRCNIWLLTDSDNSTWVKAYSIPTNNWCHECIEALRVMPHGVKLLFYNFALTLSRPRVLHVYDPRDATSTVAMKMPNKTFGRIGICSLPMESFVEPPLK